MPFPLDMLGAILLTAIGILLMMPFREWVRWIVVPRLAEPLYRGNFALTIGKRLGSARKICFRRRTVMASRRLRLRCICRRPTMRVFCAAAYPARIGMRGGLRVPILPLMEAIVVRASDRHRQLPSYLLSPTIFSRLLARSNEIELRHESQGDNAPFPRGRQGESTDVVSEMPMDPI